MQSGRDSRWIVPDGSMMLWQRVDWPAPPVVQAWVTSRAGGISTAPYDSLNLGLHVGDNRGSVLANRAQLRRALPPGTQLQWLNQVHGTHVVRVERVSGRPRRRTADAACVTAPGAGAVVLTADCLPVFFCCEEGAVVAVAHAGWRGLLGGVLESTVRSMNVPAARLMAWLGPAIAPCHFEVGDDVRKAFLNEASSEDCSRDQVQCAFVAVKDKPDKWMMDIYAMARFRLQRAGVCQVYGDYQCTVCDKELFYSFRRDGVTGRMASLIYLNAQ
jgi:polyphenol oxidase